MIPAAICMQSTTTHSEAGMQDVLFLLIIIVSFAAAIGYAIACERL